MLIIILIHATWFAVVNKIDVYFIVTPNPYRHFKYNIVPFVIIFYKPSGLIVHKNVEFPTLIIQQCSLWRKNAVSLYTSIYILGHQIGHPYMKLNVTNIVLSYINKATINLKPATFVENTMIVRPLRNVSDRDIRMHFQSYLISNAIDIANLKRLVFYLRWIGMWTYKDNQIIRLVTISH